MSEQALLAAYHNARYCVQTSDGDCFLPIGKMGDDLPKVLTAAGPFAIVTAWNPGSEVKSAQENHQRHRQLLSAIAALPHWPTWSDDGQGNWYEEGVAVWGVTDKQAIELGQRFAQAAIVWVENGEAKIRWTSRVPMPQEEDKSRASTDETLTAHPSVFHTPNALP